MLTRNARERNEMSEDQNSKEINSRMKESTESGFKSLELIFDNSPSNLPTILRLFRFRQFLVSVRVCASWSIQICGIDVKPLNQTVD